MRVRGADLAGAVFTAAVLVVADPTRTVAATPFSWLIVTVGAAIVLGVAAWQRTLVRPPKVVGWWYLAFLAWLAIAAANGADGRFAWLGIPQRHAGWLLWLICGALFVSGVRWKAVVDGMVVAGVVWLPVLLLDAVGHPWIAAGTDRLTGPFGSAAYLGAAACLVCPASLGVAFDTRRRPWWRWLAVAAAASSAFAAIGSGSRAAWVALALVGAWAGWRARRNRWLLPTVAALAAVLLLAIVTTPVIDRAGSTTDSSAAGGVSRLDEWRVGLATLGHHPLVGAGPEGYRIVFHEGVDASYERDHGRTVQADRAHNGLLDIALSGGIPAALLYVGFLVAIGLGVRARLRGTAVSAPLLGVLAAVVAYVVQQQFLFPLAEIEPVLFLLLGGVVCSGQPPLLPGRATARATAVVCGLLAAFAGWWGVRDVLAWHAAADAVAAEARGDMPAAHTAARDAVGWRDDEVWLHLQDARDAVSAQDALRAVDAALRLSPRDPIALTRRQELLVNIDPSTAFDELRGLVADDPHNATLQNLYGTAAIRSGDEVIAEHAWLAALDLAPDAPGPRQNLITLYRQQGRDAEADALEKAGNP